MYCSNRKINMFNPFITGTVTVPVMHQYKLPYPSVNWASNRVYLLLVLKGSNQIWLWEPFTCRVPGDQQQIKPSLLGHHFCWLFDLILHCTCQTSVYCAMCRTRPLPPSHLLGLHSNQCMHYMIIPLEYQSQRRWVFGFIQHCIMHLFEFCLYDALTL